MIDKQEQKAGDSSLNIQSGRDTNIILTSMEQIIEGVKNSVFPELSEIAQKTAETKIADFLKNIGTSSALEGKTLQDYSTNVDTPDFQYVARKSVLSATRIDSEDMRKTLATLLVHRLKSPDGLKTIAFNEAIEAMNRLTPDHLKIISLIFLLRSIQFTSVNSWESLKSHLENRVGKFLDFRSNYAQFEYLNYTGHAVVSQFSWDFIESLVGIYTFLFAKPINKAIIDGMSVAPKISSIIRVEKDEHGNEMCYFQARNLEDLKSKLRGLGIQENSEEDNQVVSIYNTHRITGSEAMDLFIEKTGGKEGIGEVLRNLVKSSVIERTNLTLVGTVTAISNIEIQCKEKINYDEWIEA